MSGTIDLSQLPPPDVVEPLDFESIFAERKARLISLYPADQQATVAATLELESEPVVKLLQENAYREMLLRQRVNEAARATMLAFARRADLDQRAANVNVQRLVISPGDPAAVPPIPPVMESDESLRLRVQGAPEGYSTAGPVNAYRFHALSADGRVADATAISPDPCDVIVTVMSVEGNGTADQPLLDIVAAALNDEDVRPVADRVVVQSADVVEYAIEAELFLFPGPEAEPILQAAQQRIDEYRTLQRRLGRDVRRSAIYAALHAPGVQRVELTMPVADIVLDDTQAAYCTACTITQGGTDE